MGQYVNRISDEFQKTVNDTIYVDKSGLIGILNSMINTPRCRICNSRPRRFGKTFTAGMLEAYYGKSFDSADLFSRLEISKDLSFEKHLNKYNVIHLDIQACKDRAGGCDKVTDYIQREVIAELREQFPGTIRDDTCLLAEALLATKEKFIFIVDEWDAVIRDPETTPESTMAFYDLLRTLFKGSDSAAFLSLAYLTGILPIKRVKGQSALNDFWEYTMTAPETMAQYFGFTEQEVRALCVKYNRDFEQMKSWYDGYVLGEYHIYSPVSVVKALLGSGTFKSYWSNTSSYEVIVPLIEMDYVGLKRTIAEMITDIPIPVEVERFTNDVAEIKNKDDVLTYLIHLGYLAYDEKSCTAYIPNKEIHSVLKYAISNSSIRSIFDVIEKSDNLLKATLRMDGAEVGRLLDYYHDTHTSVITYNNENALSHVIEQAYSSSVRYYLEPKRELPMGKGFADLVYIPRPEYRSEYPALVVELKWKKDAETAIDQIHKRRYPDSLVEYADKILLVGINYDTKAKEHECQIEQFDPNAKNIAAGYNKEEILALLDSSIPHDRIATTLRVSLDVVESVIEEDTIEVGDRKCSRWRISKWADNMGMSYEEFLDEVKSGKLPDTICRALQ